MAIQEFNKTYNEIIMKHLKAKISIKKVGEKMTVIASDESLDRHGEVIPINSWDLSKFKGSPRMLVDHDHRVEKIVGKWENVRVEGRQLLMEPVFHGITELSRAVEEMVKEGFLDTVSVGFIPNEPTQDRPEHSNELIETSWVTVPANPNARIAKALEMNITDEEKAQLEVFAKEAGETVVEEKEEEVEVQATMNELKDFANIPAEAKTVVVPYALLKTLIENSEKLSTLTEAPEKKVSKVSKNSFNHAVLKEMSRTLNGILMNINNENKTN